MKFTQSLILLILGIGFILSAIFNIAQKVNAEVRIASVFESRSPSGCDKSPSCTFYVEYSGCFYAATCTCYLNSMSCCKGEEGYCIHYPENRTQSKRCDSVCNSW